MEMQAVATEGPDTVASVTSLWIVELEVDKFHGTIHTWTGYATNSIEATIEAKLEYFGITGHDTSKPIRVRSCMQVGV